MSDEGIRFHNEDLLERIMFQIFQKMLPSPASSFSLFLKSGWSTMNTNTRLAKIAEWINIRTYIRFLHLTVSCLASNQHRITCLRPRLPLDFEQQDFCHGLQIWCAKSQVRKEPRVLRFYPVLKKSLIQKDLILLPTFPNH